MDYCMGKGIVSACDYESRSDGEGGSSVFGYYFFSGVLPRGPEHTNDRVYISIVEFLVLLSPILSKLKRPPKFFFLLCNALLDVTLKSKWFRLSFSMNLSPLHLEV
jgi:hypothetical protein